MKCRSFIIIALLCAVIFNLSAQEEKYIGLFVYNFTKYFNWPESMKKGDFVMQVIGHKSVYDELVRLTAGKKIGNQNIVVKHLTSIEELRRSHIIFIGHWQSKYLQDVLNSVGNYPVLIITEMEGMLDQGSAINFIIRDGTIKFEMSTSNVIKHQLKTDPRIRELAYKVVD
ncbi:MAG: YfiR family protein [Bacteroidales bacterium]|nr:YfiR family protein [Bacteroidales bacterium]